MFLLMSVNGSSKLSLDDIIINVMKYLIKY